MGASVTESVCPRCASPRDQREGPYFVCADWRWCWTVSITGTVYVESQWRPPAPGAAGAVESSAERGRRLLNSVDGLADKLASLWPAPRGVSDDHPFATEEIIRLERTRAATAADYFNEGLPLA